MDETYSNLTENTQNLTKIMYETAVSKRLTLPEAVQQLRDYAHVRTVGETLGRAAEKALHVSTADGKALKKALVDAILETNPEETRNTVSVRVSSWLNSGRRTMEKSSALELCFALRLSLEESNLLLYRLCEEGFHWRDPEELVLLYALAQGQSYADGVKLRNRLIRKGFLSWSGAETEVEKMPTRLPSSQDLDMPYTEYLYSEYTKVNSEDELEAFLRGHQHELSRLHNTAYNLFLSLLDLLRSPNGEDIPKKKRIKETVKNSMDGYAQEETKERQMNTQEIMDSYFHEQCIPRARRGAEGSAAREATLVSALQKEIRQNWPDEKTISRMRNRYFDKKRGQRVDVTRKVLILLFLATDGGNSLFGNYRTGFSRKGRQLTREELLEKEFRDRYERMNFMLTECGFAPLDARASFDWMVLYCMCSDTLKIDSQMEEFLKGVFEWTE